MDFMGAPDPNKTLYIIDAHAQIFRAYFAIRGGMNSPVTGEPTSALYGVAGVLIKLFETYQPKYVAVANDMPGKTFRDELYPEYKAHRPEPPSDLISQIPKCFELCKLFGIPVIGHQGAEADDVIATITERFTTDPAYDGFHVRIVSKDKDLEQLLSDRVEMFDIQTDTAIDVKWLVENKGIRPDQVIDLLALIGDTADNVPGVPGIGPKGAAELLKSYGSIAGIYENIDKIKGKRRENLEAAKEKVPLSQTLVKLKRDLDFHLDLKDLELKGIKGVPLRGMFAQLGFRTHTASLNRLIGEAAKPEATEAQETPGLFGAGAGGAAKPAQKPKDDGLADSLFAGVMGGGEQAGGSAPARNDLLPEGYTTAADFDYRAVTTAEDLQAVARAMADAPIVAFDTETIGLGPTTRICGLSFSWEDGKAVYVPTVSPEQATHLTLEQALEILRPVLEAQKVKKTGHNAKYDLRVLLSAGVRTRGVVFDTFIASNLAGYEAHGLDQLAMNLLKHKMIGTEELIGLEIKGRSERTMDAVALPLITRYAAGDADVSLRLYRVLKKKLDELGMGELADREEMPLVEVLAVMEHNGIRVDGKTLMLQKQEIGTKVVELREQIIKAAGVEFNPDSPKQLAEILFTRLGLPVVKKTKTGPSTDAEVLDKLVEMEHLPAEKLLVPALIGEYRQLTKLMGTYMDALKDAIDPVTQRIHASFHQTGAATGRLSSSGPNLQNIPIRSDVGRQIRKAFVAEPGKTLVVADYSQIELRFLAHFSKDAALLHAFANNIDIHTAVAAQVWGHDLKDVTREERAGAKTINFGIIYGVSAYGLSRQVSGMNVDAAKKLIADYKAKFTGIDRFLSECVAEASASGYVKTIMGRRRAIPEIFEKSQTRRALGERLAINTVIQGSAADLIKLAMVNLQARIDREELPCKLLLQIHDELVLETPQGEADRIAQVVKEEMEGAMKLDVPLVVETGKGGSWFEAK
jgi:DNA polymerase I